MSEDSTDRLFMQEALGLARMGWGLTSPNPMVGAVVVRDGVIIGRGYHFKAGEAHAEVNAFADVARHGFDAKGATLYVTLEPCCTTGRTPPCTDAILASGVKRVVIGSSDPNPHHAGRGIELLRAAGIEVTVGVEQSACSELNRPFFKWIATGKPFVILKMAMTLDGKIATASGESKWITGPEARRRVQALRRLSDAIMVGGETVRQDRPQLTVREPDSWPRQPLRIIGEPVSGMAELVSGLAGRGYRPVFFSDTSVTNMEELRRKFPAASAVPDGIYSYRVHAKKPELPMFEAFEARFGVPAFYFDDRAELIEGARKHGWNAHRFVSAEEVDKILG